MVRLTPEEENALIGQLHSAESKRAASLMSNSDFEPMIQRIRQKYIENGFLMPVYAWDGSWGRSSWRIKKFGNYVLGQDLVGKNFYAGQQGWIRNEPVWFWHYLIDGQIWSQVENKSFPEHLKIEGMPALLLWDELSTLIRDVGLFGESGGGVLYEGVTPESLSEIIADRTAEENKNGNLEISTHPGRPYWMRLFEGYEVPPDTKQFLEIRPAWFHIANYLFFNIPVTRLPAILVVFSQRGHVSTLKFLDEDISDLARDYVGKLLLQLPIELRQGYGTSKLIRENRNMTWWLWHNLWHPEYKCSLSYERIANICGMKRGTVQMGIRAFESQLREHMNSHLLGTFLQQGARMGIGYNKLYEYLVEKGLVPARDRLIDDFDDVFSL